MKLNVLSLFDGMSCGRIALDRSKIEVGTYYASEIDKYAEKVSVSNYSDIVRMGDVTNWRNWSIDWASIDLLIAGSPCQGFSIAGKQLAFDDPRSALFFVFVDILNHVKVLNPDVKFLLENVRMKKEYLAIISEHLGVEPVFINSHLVSAQQRARYYWANWGFDEPISSSVVLKDVLEHGVCINDKSYCLDANYFKGANPSQFIAKSRRELIFLGADEKGLRLKDGKFYSRNFREGYRIYSVKGLAAALTAKSKGGPGGASGLYGDIINDTVYYRKLTPVECERLQTVPDNYTNHVSNTQRYKMLGNGWTVDVISHIFNGLKSKGVYDGIPMGPCAKRQVTCTLIAPSGKRFSGGNWCRNPQKECPRDEGEGYEKCSSICEQVGHAEEVSLMIAGDQAKGCRALISGHDYACDPCTKKLNDAGVVEISILKPKNVSCGT